MYACFDQPDLKADVHLPRHRARSLGGRVQRPRRRRVEDLPAGKTVHFATTARISPYITALVAGPYHVVARPPRRHRPRPLVPQARSPQHLDADELFDGHQAGLRLVPRQLRHPVRRSASTTSSSCPSSTPGAMENAGCVTFREDYVFRSKVTDARYERRAETILHEMAHMWFGDLVTMRWWDDLWLNESFATYASMLCQTERDPLDGRLDDVRQRREDLGLPPGPAALDPPDRHRRPRRADRRGQLRRHHLRQGRERAQAARRLRRRRGVPRRAARLLRRARLRQHHAGRPAARAGEAPPAATSATGRSCGSRPPASTRSARSSRSTTTATTRSFEIVQSAPTEVATSNTLRPHRLAIGCYDERDGAAGPHRPGRARRHRRAHRGRRAGRRAAAGAAAGQRRRPDLLQAAPGRATACRRCAPAASPGSTDSLPRALAGRRRGT